MSKILEEVLQANEAYAETFGELATLAMPPARHFAILTCMDARLDPAKFAGLAEGDAHVIRNAGGRASDDAIRSLVISYKLLGTREWFVIHHTDCGMLTFTNDIMRDLLASSLQTATMDNGQWMDMGEGPGSPAGDYVEWLTIQDLQKSVVADVTRIRTHPLVPKTIPVYGYIYEVGSGKLIEVPEATLAGSPEAAIEGCEKLVGKRCFAGVWFAFAVWGTSEILSAQPRSIRRLDGTRISITQAEVFVRETLASAHVTGAQIAVLDKGHLVWSAAFGLRRREPALPFNRETTTWAASITKSVFAVYVMQLVEHGEFQLDVPIAKQLTRPLDSYEAYRSSASELVKDPAWLQVTPRMLLSHSSGLLNFATMEPDKKMRLHFKPGTQFNYSGEGVNLVQFAIEQRKVRPLADLMQEAFFKPLAMTRSSFIYQKEFAENVADRYDLNEKFRAQTRRFPARAAGSMTTSAEDLARFTSALVNGRLLKHASLKNMLTPVLSIRSLHQFAAPSDESEGLEAAGVGLAYGVGWGLLTHTNFGPAFFKEGHGDGAQNYMVCFQRRKACMILLTNSDNGELTFRPLLEKILGDTVTPWEWEGYTPSYIKESRKHQ